MTGLFNHPKRKLKKFIHDGEYEQAIEHAKSMEDEYSDDPDFLFIMGSMFYILEDEKKSLYYLQRVLEFNKFDVEALSLKLRIHQFLKENDDVIDCCKRILNVDSENHEVKDILDQLEES